MTLTGSIPNPIRPTGCVVNLACVVHIPALSLAVDTPLIQLRIMWRGPDGFRTIKTLEPILGNSTTYTSRAAISSFGRNESGIYMCTASLSSTNFYLINSGTTSSDSISLTTGEKLEKKKLSGSAYFLKILFVL